MYPETRNLSRKLVTGYRLQVTRNMSYLTWDEKTIADFSDKNINSLYNEGYVFTRLVRGFMHQTRSLRIDLSKFELSSENRRILKKTEGLQLMAYSLPLTNYHWSIGKMGHDFYETKFGKGTFSANKIKELMTDPEKSNFNRVLVYCCDHPTSPAGLCAPPSKGGDSKRTMAIQKLSPPLEGGVADPATAGEAWVVGYAIALETDEILHYAYPFYGLQTCLAGRQASDFRLQNVGLGMMLKAILYAQEQKKKYIYLGSAQRPADTYKLQFAGLEWFDGKEWQSDIVKLKVQL